jgi:hypothetical protein
LVEDSERVYMALTGLTSTDGLINGTWQYSLLSTGLSAYTVRWVYEREYRASSSRSKVPMGEKHIWRTTICYQRPKKIGESGSELAVEHDDV